MSQIKESKEKFANIKLETFSGSPLSSSGHSARRYSMPWFDGLADVKRETQVSKTTVKTGDWVVVCDGRKALILENAGDSMFLNLHTKETYDHPDKSTHEQGTSPPGRSFQSVGHGRSAVTQTDWHDEAERAFLKSLAERLNTAVVSGQTKAITMIAPPRALGMIRPEYSPALRRAIVLEIGKDLVKQPVHEIERLIASESEN